jgi:hypothetical protein
VVRLGCVLEVLDPDVDKESDKVGVALLVEREVTTEEDVLAVVCTVKIVELAMATVVGT